MTKSIFIFLFSQIIMLLFGNEISAVQYKQVKKTASPDTLTTSIKAKKNFGPITEPNELLRQIENNEVKVLFYGNGTEPFWYLYITKKEVLFTENEDINSYTLLTPFNKNKRKQIIKYRDSNGKIFSITIKKEPASDGMSDRVYPYLVIRSKTEYWLNGAGDIKMNSGNNR